MKQITFIYIPLCFYFIGINRKVYIKYFLIYIPLCFYFIGKHGMKHMTIINLHSTMLLLYLDELRAVNVNNHNLHSTMLLLYQYPHITKEKAIMIYIPLCFYFIPPPLFPFYFLQYRYTFCLPPFFIALLSKIFLLPLYKI